MTLTNGSIVSWFEPGVRHPTTSTVDPPSLTSYSNSLLPVLSTLRPSAVSPTPLYGTLLAHTLWIYFSPVIFVVGLCGNILILAVMSQRRMRGTSTCVYLQWMAVADLFVILSGMISELLEAHGIIILKETDPILCKLEKFALYTSSDTSIWICVAFTVDRFVAICFPFLQRRSCKASHAKYYAMAATAASIAKNLHVLWTRGAQYEHVVSNSTTQLIVTSNCGYPAPQFRNFEIYIRPWIAFTLVTLIPFCIIVFCNIFIVAAMIRLKRARQMNLIISAQDNTVFQMTALCLSASFCFLVCITPSIILLIGKPYWNSPPSDWYLILKSVVNQMFYVNHSVNFFLYCMTGQRFRRAMSALCRCGRAASDGYSSTAAACQFSAVTGPAGYRTHVSPAINRRRATMNGAMLVHSVSHTANKAIVASYLTPTGDLVPRPGSAGLQRKSLPAILLLSSEPRRESIV